jgi:hypothetical protein
VAAQIFNLGKLRFSYKGAYNGATTYQQNDVVLYQNSIYVYTNIVSGSGVLPSNVSYWSEMIKGLIDPAAGLNGQFVQTTGSNFQFSSISQVPSQSTHNGKLLTTDGSVASWTATPSLTSITTSGDVTVGDDLYVGSGAAAFETSATLTDAAAVFKIDGGESSFAQIAFTNAEPTSSTDLILYMNNGNDSNGWMGMGITGSQFDDTTYGITGPGDGYIFHDTLNDTFTGNMVFATGASGSDNKIIFAAGGYNSGNTQMEITPDVNVHIEIPTPSTSPTTGALTVVGGVGIQGDMNIQGNVSIEGTITFGGSGTTVETSNLAVTDPAVFVGTNNQSDIVDLAFIGEYATAIPVGIVATVNNKALTSNVATLTTASAHTYLAGDVVTITGVDATFNGTFNIIAVPTSTTFTYAKTAANVTSAAVSPTGTATVNARRKFAGIARDASDGIIKVFRDATTKPSTTVNFSEAGLTYATVKMGGAEIGSVTNTEIGYLSGVTSSIQTQINARALATSGTLTKSLLVSSKEAVSISATAATGTVAIDLNTDSVKLFTSNANANWIFNLRGDGSTTLNSIMSTGESMTCAVLVPNGGTAYYPTSIQVDGTTSGVTTRWQGGSAPTSGNASSTDSYTLTVIKTANATFTVFASQTRFA